MSYLTKADYGLYQMVGSLISCMAIMDFGLSTTIVRYYSKYEALADQQGKENILAIFSGLYVLITIGCMIVGYLLFSYIDIIYSGTLSFQELSNAKTMYIILLVNIIITIPSHIFRSVIIANEKFVFLKLVIIIQICLKPVLVATVLAQYASVISLVMIETGLNMLVIISNVAYCFRKINMKIKYHFWDDALLREIVGFSFFIFLSVFVDQVYWRTSPMILGAIAGTSEVAIYSVASVVCLGFMNFSVGVSGVFLPKISHIVTKTQDMSAINDLFIKTGRIQFMILGLICSGFILFGKEFLRLWVGIGFDESYVIASILLLALLIPLIQNQGIMILQALNKHAFRAKLYVVLSILNLMLSIPAAKLYGGIGCAAVTGGALLAGNGIMINYYYKKYIGLDIGVFFREIAKLSLPVTFAMVVGWGLSFVVDQREGWTYFLPKTAFYSLIYCFVVWKYGMNRYEKGLIREFLKGKFN